MARFKLIAVSNSVEGREHECTTWYDDTHLRDMLQVPGVVSAQLFELLRGAPSKAFKHYLAIYEIEAEDEEAARMIINALNAANLTLSESLDVSSVNLGVFRAAGARQTRG